jgi:L-lactate dehydrogenase complex protein LldE
VREPAPAPGRRATGDVRVALFVTCLVDLFRPSVGFAAVKLLENAGCVVEVPVQTCCGQPAYNSGDLHTARDVARQVIDAFAAYEYVVAPSGSCAGMVKVHYPRLFADDPEWGPRAADLAGRTHELVRFLTDVRGIQDVDARFEKVVTYHDACSGLRELGTRDEPRRLLGTVAGLELSEMAETEVCCGFGGTFCVKYPQVSERMVSDKVASIGASGAQVVLAADLGCLMQIAGRLSRTGSTVKAYHIAEVLAGMAEGPGIGEGSES